MAAPRSNARVAFTAVGIFVAMIGLAYASVPLYKAFCARTGFDGTPLRAEKAPDKATDKTITIRFDANVSGGLTWRFAPRVTTMQVRIGEQNMAYFDGTNLADHTKTGSAVFNVSPVQAAGYFNKIQCFCFTEQTLKAGESAAFPVSFFVDPAIVKDADTAGIQEITLSYTFYPAEPSAAKQANAN